MTIGERIKHVRNYIDLPQDKFAERIGITKSSVSLIENDKNNPSEQTLKLICKEFGISPSWLKAGAGEMIDPASDDSGIKLVYQMMEGENDFAKAVFTAFAKLSPESWRKLREVVDELQRKK